MNKTFFVTGTDTDAGKTFVSQLMLKALNARQKKTLGLKPVAAGCEKIDGQWRNDDALKLQQAMSVALPYEQVNPVALEPPVAPHLAAQAAGKRITVDQLSGKIRGALMQPHDVALVEGAGGWLVPLNDRESLADLALNLNLPVVLVVGVRLGCLNHALLTAQSIAAMGLPLVGWVANCIDPNAALIEENIDSLKTRLPAPCLGEIPHAPEPDWGQIIAHFNTDLLLNRLGLD